MNEIPTAAERASGDGRPAVSRLSVAAVEGAAGGQTRVDAPCSTGADAAAEPGCRVLVAASIDMQHIIGCLVLVVCLLDGGRW